MALCIRSRQSRTCVSMSVPPLTNPRSRPAGDHSRDGLRQALKALDLSRQSSATWGIRRVCMVCTPLRVVTATAVYIGMTAPMGMHAGRRISTSSPTSTLLYAAVDGRSLIGRASGHFTLSSPNESRLPCSFQAYARMSGALLTAATRLGAWCKSNLFAHLEATAVVACIGEGVLGGGGICQVIGASTT